jgi:LDH2 family malate/lactate/ureidoglycolate dehydrogenase
MDCKQDVGHFFFLLDISAFMEVAEFKLRLDKAIDEIKTCRKRPGINEILVPGERSYQKARQNLAEGISIDEATRKELKALCEELRVKYTLEEAVGHQPLAIS